MEMENEFGYFSKDVSIELEITASTLRRWSIELEKEGYSFSRNDRNQRIYFERDYSAFKELKKLLANSVPVSDAIKAIASTDFEKKCVDQTLTVHSDIMRLTKRELREIVKVALEEERKIILAALQENMDNKIEIRDRLLMQQMNIQFQEKQKVMVIQQEQKKKNWLQKCFSFL
ncbi:DNA-binding protein [Viridibacillus arvi]|uniref:DNA-binding protein n=1 Tax=Viridibacillus arvi TaxID=263475 RepID=UPI0034D00F4E